MSIGPSSRTQKEISTTSVRAVAGSMLTVMRKNPANALFLFGLALLLVGLPLNVVFPSAYYGVMALLGVILLGRWNADKNAEKAEKKKK